VSEGKAAMENRMKSTDHDPLARALGALPAPAIDPAFAARIGRRARAAYRQPLSLRPGEVAVPALMLAAGLFYTAASFELMLRIFG